MAAAPDPTAVPAQPAPAQNQQPTPEQQERARLFAIAQKVDGLCLRGRRRRRCRQQSHRQRRDTVRFVRERRSGARTCRLNRRQLVRVAAQANRGRNAAYNKDNESRMLPQMTMATEDYNRLVRMIQNGAKPKMTVDIQAQYHDEDLMGYNTDRRDPGHRSDAQGRDRDARRAPRFVAFGYRCDRQRRRLCGRDGSGAHSSRFRFETATDDPRRALER